MLTRERLKEIKQRAERATEGPWGVRHRCSGCTPDDDEAAGLGLELVGPPQPLNKGQFARAADAQFCAHAREDVPALVAELERLHGFLRQLRKRVEYWRLEARNLRRDAEDEADAEERDWLYGKADGWEHAADQVEAMLNELGARAV